MAVLPWILCCEAMDLGWCSNTLTPFLATVEILLCSWVSVYLALASLGFNPHRGATERPVPSEEVLPDLGRPGFVFLGCFMLYQGLGFWQSGNLLCFVSADCVNRAPSCHQASGAREECQEQCTGQRKTNNRRLENVLCVLREKSPPDATREKPGMGSFRALESIGMMPCGMPRGTRE